jgi:DNA replication protein DnaC
MGCLKGGVVANVVVPTPDYVRFASHYRFRPDFCEARDPESKGIVEALVRYSKNDLMIPLSRMAAEHRGDLDQLNAAAADWCAEVNAAVHSEICAVPLERLAQTERDLLAALPSLRPAIGRRELRKVDKLATVRFASVRYSVPNRMLGQSAEVIATDQHLTIIVPGTGEVLAEHILCAPGGSSIVDEHYGRVRPTTPRRKVRPRSAAETAFLALGPVAETWLCSAAASGTHPARTRARAARGAAGRARPRRAAERAGASGQVRQVESRRRPVDPGRRHRRPDPNRARTGAGARTPRDQAASAQRLPPGRPDRRGQLMATTAPAPLAADLELALRRLKLAAMRRVAPELLVTAKTQRWASEELLRALVETEIAARDASNVRLRGKQAAFPTVKTIAGFDLAASSIPAPTWDYLTSLEWVNAKENLTLIGPAGTGKSHTLIALGHAAVEAGLRVRYFTAAELVENLYRGLADNSVGKLIDTVLRNDLVVVDELGFAPLDSNGSQLLFRFVAAAYERRSLAIASHWPFEEWGRFLPDHSTAVSLLDRLLHHNHVVATDGESYRMREARSQRGGRPRKR